MGKYKLSNPTTRPTKKMHKTKIQTELESTLWVLVNLSGSTINSFKNIKY